MVHKRPGAEDLYTVSCKLRRQEEHLNQLNSVMGAVPCSGGSQKLQSPDDKVEGGSSKSQDGGSIVSDSFGESVNGSDRDFETNSSSGVSRFLWVNGNMMDEEAKSEAADYSSLFSEYFEPDHQVRALVQPNVPEWGEWNCKNSVEPLNQYDPQDGISDPLGIGLLDDDASGNKFLGTCILPMPDLEPSIYNSCDGGGDHRDCSCLDQGSIRCVQKHVKEEREKLRDILGQKIFEELGFCDMGEEVAMIWSDQEEQRFNDVVLSNPASLGKNFWDHISVFFPSRTKKELVSYYFNVFMLRKRAEQNRFDPLNIDSDNDEWHWSELGFTEGEDDAGMESHILRVASVYDKGQGEDELVDAKFMNCRKSSGEIEDDLDGVAKTQFSYLDGDCSLYSDFKLPDVFPISKD